MIDDINIFLNNDAIFSKLSDVTRIVDPLLKRVIEYKNENVDMEDSHCFDFWSRNKICENCISMRAYNENLTFVKIEYNKEKTYMITAVPYNFPGRRVVIEILKDITNSIVFNSADRLGMELADIHSLVDNINRLAFCDTLTGVFNRRYIMEKMPVDLLNNTLLSMEMTLMMIDIDHFKNINDTYGHLAGDQAIKSVVKTLSDCLNDGNHWVSRYGGEEFLVCMTGTDLETAKTVAEYMRESIEKTTIRHEGVEFQVTASFGLNNVKSTESIGVDDLLKCVDEKLYSAKKNGRNRVEW